MNGQIRHVLGTIVKWLIVLLTALFIVGPFLWLVVHAFATSW